MNETEVQIGKKIREYRRNRQMTQAKLATEVGILLNESVTDKTISAWERGTRSIYARQLFAIASVLQCTVHALCTFDDDVDWQNRLLLELHDLSDYEKHVLHHAAATWEGRTHPLIAFAALYMSLDSYDRPKIVKKGIAVYKDAKSKGHLVPHSPSVDVDYIEEECKKISKHREWDIKQL